MATIERLVLQGDLAAVHRQLTREGYDPVAAQQLIAVFSEIAALPSNQL